MPIGSTLHHTPLPHLGFASTHLFQIERFRNSGAIFSRKRQPLDICMRMIDKKVGLMLAISAPLTTTKFPNTLVPLSWQPRWIPPPRPNQTPHTYAVHHAKMRLLQAEASTNAPTSTQALAGPRQLASTTYREGSKTHLSPGRSVERAHDA
jgi:hypothetical protein